ncbi:cytochrome c family protein [Paramagnetospirillum magnetotacticum MS-1]|uniref:Cytochrome c family protein n=1 Tax=Paramagnetospirillum magnetotacticum MS-1 TaxID=272627 RepID=A0A0C2YZ35_PARME|nr:cytochrome c family protein [Paramagnetospirillum magnetotacticum MS-1]
MPLFLCFGAEAEEYWSRPLKAQGIPPAAWSELEESLDPQSCGACHPDKLAQWSGSLHSKAFSPGLVGQLLALSKEDTQDCLDCHAPLAEQAAAFEAARKKGNAHRPEAQGLAAAGNSCGGCHLRGHQRFGPPQRSTGAVGRITGDLPHGGFTGTKDFERSEFCAACHQFSADQAINGKPLENTIEEWRASPQAAAGQTCQFCHMPDRQHLWRGIHDPATTAAGLTPKTSSDQDKARFAVTSTGVGHAFPTYVTPKVILHAVLLDGAGQPRPGTEKTHIIQRRVEFDGSDWREISDTRLAPGQTASVEIAWKDATRARVWLEVQPDDFYHSVTYAQLRRDLPKSSAASRLIAEADSRTRSSIYRLFTTEIERPSPSGDHP